MRVPALKTRLLSSRHGFHALSSAGSPSSLCASASSASSAASSSGLSRAWSLFHTAPAPPPPTRAQQAQAFAMAAIKRYTPFLVSSAVWRPFRLTESAIGRALDDDFGGLDYILPVLLVWVVGGMFINARTQARFKLSTQDLFIAVFGLFIATAFLPMIPLELLPGLPTADFPFSGIAGVAMACVLMESMLLQEGRNLQGIGRYLLEGLAWLPLLWALAMQAQGRDKYQIGHVRFALGWAWGQLMTTIVKWRIQGFKYKLGRSTGLRDW